MYKRQLLDQPAVSSAIELLGRNNGEVWFKLDAGSTEAIWRINGVHLDPESVAARLCRCAELCPTWVQTCCFAQDGFAPSETEMTAWLGILGLVGDRLAGVHLYGLARPSQQVEAPRLARLPAEWLEALAERVRKLGLTVVVSP